MNDDTKCFFCGSEYHTLYQGWFKAHITTEFNKGTASDGLIINTISCKDCALLHGKKEEDFNFENNT